MPTKAQIEFNVHGLVAAWLPTIVAKQQNHVENRGIYWQAAATHSVVPTHTNDVWDNRPGDQLEGSVGDSLGNWSNTLPEIVGVDLPVSMACATYEGPDGKGWVLELNYKHEGESRYKAINVGPEAQRQTDWITVVDGP